jgi:ABC-2 type transport system permease protein
MHGIWKLIEVELKLYLREPFATFFTLAFPVMMLFLFGSIYGNKPTPFFGGLGSVDVSVPAYTAMIIASVGIVTITITLASYREKGVLRRLRATPLRPQAILITHVFVIFLMTIIGMTILIISGKWIYNLRFNGDVFSMLLAFTLSCLSIFSLGFFLAGILSNARTAQIVSMVIFYPMIFLSGATIPKEILPKTIQEYSQILPLTHVVNLLRGLWVGDSLSNHFFEITILLIILIIFVFASSKTFKWE